MSPCAGVGGGDIFVTDELVERWRSPAGRGPLLDAGAAVVCAGYAAAMAIVPPSGLAEPPAVWWIDLACGVAASILLLGSRRWLLPVAVGITGLGGLVSTAGAAVAVALFLLARRRPFRVAALTAGLGLLSNTIGFVLRMSDPDIRSVLRNLLVVGTLAVAVLASGSALRSRGRLLAALIERAEQAEQTARSTERTQIAREMHDVLAHRISLLAMHAGSLTYRDRLAEEEVRDGLDTIADSARSALDDLHAMLRVLREPATEPAGPFALVDGDAAHPQPSLRDLPRLVESVRRAGVDLESHCSVTAPDEVPQLVGRTVYRVAQEALTNAAKHAPGRPVILIVTESPRRTLQLTISNRLPVPAVEGPGCGSGLVGIRERIELAGGTVTSCGVDRSSSPARFLVQVTVPWRR